MKNTRTRSCSMSNGEAASQAWNRLGRPRVPSRWTMTTPTSRAPAARPAKAPDRGLAALTHYSSRWSIRAVRRFDSAPRDGDTWEGLTLSTPLRGNVLPLKQSFCDRANGDAKPTPRMCLHVCYVISRYTPVTLCTARALVASRRPRPTRYGTPPLFEPACLTRHNQATRRAARQHRSRVAAREFSSRENSGPKGDRGWSGSCPRRFSFGKKSSTQTRPAIDG